MNTIKENIQTLIKQNFFEQNKTNSCIYTVATAITEMSDCCCVYERLINTSSNISVAEFISLVEEWADPNHIIYLDMFTCSHVVLLFYDKSYYILNSYENLYPARVQEILLEDIFNMEFDENVDILYNKYFNTNKPCRTFLPKYSGIMFKVYKIKN